MDIYEIPKVDPRNLVWGHNPEEHAYSQQIEDHLSTSISKGDVIGAIKDMIFRSPANYNPTKFPKLTQSHPNNKLWAENPIVKAHSSLIKTIEPVSSTPNISDELWAIGVYHIVDELYGENLGKIHMPTEYQTNLRDHYQNWSEKRMQRFRPLNAQRLENKGQAIDLDTDTMDFLGDLIITRISNKSEVPKDPESLGWQYKMEKFIISAAHQYLRDGELTEEEIECVMDTLSITQYTPLDDVLALRQDILQQKRQHEEYYALEFEAAAD